MSTSKKRKQIFVEASCLSENRMSGIGHMTLETIKALVPVANNAGYEVCLAVPFDKINEVKLKKIKGVNYKKIYIPMRIFNIIWKYDLLPPIDIFFGKGIYIFPNYKNWRLLRSSSLTYICDLGYKIFPEFVSPKNQIFLAKNISKWAQRSTKIIAISEDAKRDLIKYLKLSSDKITTVYCGVDTGVYFKQPKDKISKIKQNIGVDGNYILYVGNIEPRKNISSILSSYKTLKPEIIKKFSLVLVGGGGWLNEEIDLKIKEMQFQGYKIIKPNVYVPDKDLPSLYSGATALIHPAYYEGFGISPLQSLACGTPVVVSNASSLPEVVGDAGLYVNPNSIKDISVKINTILSDVSLQKKLVKNGEEITQKYTWQKSAKLIMKEIENING